MSGNSSTGNASASRRWSDSWVDFVAGWCSGAVSVVVLQPLDTVLTRWQAQHRLRPQAPALSPGRTAPGPSPSWPAAATAGSLGRQVAMASGDAASLASSSSLSYLRVARSLTSTAGIRSLWRGASPMIGAVPFQNALLMGGYGIGQSWVADPRHPDRLLAVFVGGCAGGILQSFLMSPVELAKVAAQVRHAGAAPLTVRDMARRVAGNLNVGLGATLLRDGVPHGVWFASYEAAKHRLIRLQQERDNGRGVAPWLPVDSPMAPPLLAGAFAATVAWIVGYPADLIKTRLQSGASSSSAGGGGIARTARDIVRDGGGSYLALYRGLGLKLVRAVPASMIGFGTYELVKAEMSSLS